MPTGLDSQIGVAKESVAYGTYEPSSDFLIFDSETLSRSPNHLSSAGLGSGALVPRISLHRETTRAAEGSLALKVPNVGFGVLLDLLHGNAVVPVQEGVTAAYLQTHEIGEVANNSKSASIQVGKPSVISVEPFTALGCVPTQVAFACETSGELTCDYQVDARDLVNSQALEVNNPPADWTPRDFTEATVLINDIAVAVLIRSFNLTIPFPRKTDRYGLGSGALKAFPLQNDYMRPTFSLATEFTDTDLYDHFVNEDEVDVKVRFTGPEIAATFPYLVEFQAPAVKVVGSTPQVGGPDILEFESPVEVYSDGTNPPVSILYRSTDVTL